MDLLQNLEPVTCNGQLGVGASPAGLVLARPLFWRFNLIAHTSCAPNATYYAQATSKVLPTPLVSYFRYTYDVDQSRIAYALASTNLQAGYLCL